MQGTNPLTMRYTYETLCGWCDKWEKKCDRKIGGGNDVEPRKKKDAVLEDIRSGKGLSRLDTTIDPNKSLSSGIRKEF